MEYSLEDNLPRQMSCGTRETLAIDRIVLYKEGTRYGGTVKESSCRWAADEDDLIKNWGVI